MKLEGRRGVVVLGVATLAAAVAGCGFDVQLAAPAGAGGQGVVAVSTGIQPTATGAGGEGSSAFSASSGVGDCGGLPTCAQCVSTTCDSSACTQQSGFCDDFGNCATELPVDCAMPDACGDAPCGTLCSPPCDPMNMMCPSGVFVCDGSGSCVDIDGAACPSIYRPCATSACGDSCTICDPKLDPSCVDPGVLTVCTATGECGLAQYSACAEDTCSSSSCGEPCWLCNPMDAGCQMEMQGQSPDGSCDMFGNCLGAAMPYCPCPPTMMGCSLPCTACPPMDPGCEEPGGPEVCDSSGRCVPQMMCN